MWKHLAALYWTFVKERHCHDVGTRQEGEEEAVLLLLHKSIPLLTTCVSNKSNKNSTFMGTHVWACVETVDAVL